MNLGFNINFFLGLQSQIKINHWQTKSYSRHVAFDEFFDKMNSLIDDFVEISVTKNGKFVLDDETDTIQLVNLSDLDIKSFLNTIKIAITQISDNVKEDTDLVNILDEMLTQINKLSYKLSLR